jgi:hypothetical protein
MGRSADGSRELTEAVGDRYGGHISDARPMITPLRIVTCPSAHLPTCPPANWKSAPVIGHNGSPGAVTWHFFSESMEAAAAPKQC